MLSVALRVVVGAMILTAVQAAGGMAQAVLAKTTIPPTRCRGPYLPDAVRWPHFFEVGISNFLYGSLIGWLLTRLRATAAVAQPQAAPGV